MRMKERWTILHESQGSLTGIQERHTIREIYMIEWIKSIVKTLELS